MFKNITPAEYKKLEGIDTIAWTPVYKGYKTSKQREYHECEDGYRHFIGWETITTPVGNPLHYTYHKPSAMEISSYQMIQMWSKKFIDSANNNLVFTKDLGESKTITFSRYSDV